MKIVILNGSPRSNGKISQMLEIIGQQLAENHDNQIVSYNSNEQVFKFCTGCMACRQRGKCCLPYDDAQKIADDIRDCDTLVIGTPTYWGNMSGSLKALLDREVGVLMAESKLGMPHGLHKGKKALIITACTTPFPFNIICKQSTKAITSIKEVLFYSGFKVAGKLTLPGTKRMKLLPLKYEDKCKELAGRL